MRDQFEGDQVVLENALPFLLHGIYQRIRGVTYREFNQHGLELTPEQWIVLARLWQRDGRTVSELSESTLRDIGAPEWLHEPDRGVPLWLLERGRW